MTNQDDEEYSALTDTELIAKMQKYPCDSSKANR